LDGVRYASIAPRRPEDYIAQASKGLKDRPWELERLEVEDVADERVLMGLRLLSGFKMSDYEDIAGKSLDKAQIELFVEDNLLNLDGKIISLTDEGRLLADYISSNIIV
jgi:oxygen-independent coproporphyrinogen-3 oxidase